METITKNDRETWGVHPSDIKGEIALFFGNARISKRRYHNRNDRKRILDEWEQLHDYKNRKDAFIEVYPS